MNKPPTKLQVYREAALIALVWVGIGAMACGFIAVVHLLTGPTGLFVMMGLGVFALLTWAIAQDAL